jgi:hypothetical protein
MSEAMIEEILQKIDQLPVAERHVLEERLAEREEAEWRQAASEARRTAKERGLDQAAIDEAVHRVRYSK